MADSHYWVYENGYLRGPFKIEELAKRENFAVTMLICRDGDHVWRPVHEISEIAPVLAEVAHTQVVASGDYLSESSTSAPPLVDAETREPDLT